MAEKYGELIEKIRETEGKRLLILTHDFPDVDAISSAFALQNLLREDGVQAEIVYGGRIDRSSTEKLVALMNIKGKGCDGHFTDEDALIFIDCQAGTGNTTRTGGKALACIDHHPTSPDNASTYEFRKAGIVGACITLVTEFYMEEKREIPKDVATALLYGLKMDTKNFMRAVTKRDIEVFGYLLDRVDEEKLHYMETSQLEVGDLKAYGSAISNMKIVSDIGTTYIPFDCPDGLIATLAEFMLDLDEVGVSIVFSKRTNGIKLSIRTILPFFDAGKFANDVLKGIGSGGGHAMSAGGFIPNESFIGHSEEEWSAILMRAFLREYGNQLMKTV